MRLQFQIVLDPNSSLIKEKSNHIVNPFLMKEHNIDRTLWFLTNPTKKMPDHVRIINNVRKMMSNLMFSD